MQRQPETTDECPSSTLVQYIEVNAIFGSFPIPPPKRGPPTSTKARRDNYPAIAIRLLHPMAG